jgi:hypothetical protein
MKSSPGAANYKPGLTDEEYLSNSFGFTSFFGVISRNCVIISHILTKIMQVTQVSFNSNLNMCPTNHMILKYHVNHHHHICVTSEGPGNFMTDKTFNIFVWFPWIVSKGQREKSSPVVGMCLFCVGKFQALFRSLFPVARDMGHGHTRF